MTKTAQFFHTQTNLLNNQHIPAVQSPTQTLTVTLFSQK